MIFSSRIWVCLGVGIAFLLGFISCSKRGTPVETGNKEQILHRAIGAEPSDLDPQIVTGLPEALVVSALFEGLVESDPVTLEIIPAVAESWEVSEDGKTYTFHLRKNAKWSNGDPVTAQDFVFAYNRILSPSLGAAYASFLYLLEGAEDFNKKRLTDFKQVGVKALDDYTLELKLVNPTPYFLRTIVHHSWCPVHRKAILKHGAIDKRGTGWMRGDEAISNGPFRLKKWLVSDVVMVEKNPYYWDNKQVPLKRIHFYPMEDSNTEERAFRAGQLHITETVPSSRISNYIENHSPYLKVHSYFSTYAYVFNCRRPPFDDVRVRKALSLALDRQAIVDNVRKRGEIIAGTYVPPGIPGYNLQGVIKEDIEEAKRLLAEAGYPEGKGFPEIVLGYNTNVDHRSVAEALQQMWAKHLGIQVTLQNMEWKVYLSSRRGDDFNLIRFGWQGDYLDPNAFLEIFASDNGNNFSKWSNDHYDQLLKQASETLDAKARFEILRSAEDILLEELPVLPLFYYNSAHLVQGSVQGFYPNIMDYHPYKGMYLKK